MLKLKNVTLLAIDAINPGKTLRALLYSTRFVEFADVILVTDTLRHQTLSNQFGFRLLHTVQSNDKIEGPDRAYFRDYEHQMLTVPAEVVKTDFVLIQEWDAAVLNPSAWDPGWLSVDYIGACWFPYYLPGWPPMVEGANVGNGGFSLRSRHFCDLVRKAATEWADDPSKMAHDCWMCRTMRPWLETNGICFASTEQALRFSCEDSVYTGQFGFHGKETVKLNGWTLPWF